MKERFVFGSSNRTTGRRWLLSITLIAVIILAVDLLTHGSVRSYVRGFAPRVTVAGNAGTDAVVNTGFFATHSALAHENAALKIQIAQYQDQVSENAVLREQNDQLRSLVDLAASEHGITAVVVSSYLASPYGTFLISVHAPDVANGDLVLSGGGFVIGRIANAGPTTSLVREVFASDASIEGLVSGADATIDGYGGGNARAALPRDVHVAVGDLVLAPTLGGRPVGVVGSVESSAASADQKVYIRLPVNLSSIRYVHVVPAQ
jgi:cell shape-determining protein MreC